MLFFRSFTIGWIFLSRYLFICIVLYQLQLWQKYAAVMKINKVKKQNLKKSVLIIVSELINWRETIEFEVSAIFINI